LNVICALRDQFALVAVTTATLLGVAMPSMAAGGGGVTLDAELELPQPQRTEIATNRPAPASGSRAETFMEHSLTRKTEGVESNTTPANGTERAFTRAGVPMVDAYQFLPRRTEHRGGRAVAQA